MMVSAMLFYKKLMEKLIVNGSKVNPYGPSLVNKIVQGWQETEFWYADESKAFISKRGFIFKLAQKDVQTYWSIQVNSREMS